MYQIGLMRHVAVACVLLWAHCCLPAGCHTRSGVSSCWLRYVPFICGHIADQLINIPASMAIPTTSLIWEHSVLCIPAAFLLEIFLPRVALSQHDAAHALSSDNLYELTCSNCCTCSSYYHKTPENNNSRHIPDERSVARTNIFISAVLHFALSHHTLWR